MNRRQLFDHRHLAQAAGHVLGALEAREPERQEIALVRLGWRAMATGWEILLPIDVPGSHALGQEVFELLDALEDQLTVYRDHSEVCRINRLAPSRPVRVEPRLFGLLELAAGITRESQGAFDVSTGALVKAWGFFRGPRRVPGPEELASLLERVGMRHVELDSRRRTVRLACQGVECNLGSIGKGYALDRMVERIRERRNSLPVLLHGGSSSVYAGGDPLGDGRGWRVRIRHPWIEGRHLAEVWLRDRALGTSAATFQYLEHEGRKLGHVLDPRTGWPASGLASVSVVAPSAARADALSTAFYVGGIDLARACCEADPEIGAILLPEDAREPIVIGLTPAEYTLLVPPR